MNCALRPTVRNARQPAPAKLAPEPSMLDRRFSLSSSTMFAFGRQGVKAMAAAADALWRTRTGLVVLIYHRVGGRTCIETDLPLHLFEDQLDFLAKQGNVVTLDEGLEAISSRPPTASNVVAITFDDGTADFADVALPILGARNLPVTLYLATDFVESQRPFPHDGRPLSWDALRDALDTGLVTIGSHTHRHALLDRLPLDQVDDELDRSIGLIGERLGVVAEHFAYPKAVLGSPSAQRVVRSRFRSAALAGTRPNPFGATDPFRLARSPIQVSDGVRWFERKARGGLSLEDAIRTRFDRLRFRTATT
jgi:peptidoglycan/xylan/chitin deacetylase (PgdA/CDA1 family)